MSVTFSQIAEANIRDAATLAVFGRDGQAAQVRSLEEQVRVLARLMDQRPAKEATC